MNQRLLFELLQIAIGNRDSLSFTPTEDDWKRVFKTAIKQSLIGIVLFAVERLPKQQWPSLGVVNTFIGLSLKIESDNVRKSNQCLSVSGFFNDNGFSTCILKGQGNLDFYPANLQKRRQSGDVDIWVWPSTKTSRPKKDVIDFCLSKIPMDRREEAYNNLRQHHIDFPYFEDLEVEVHFSPIYFNCPWINRRWKHFCENAQKNELIESSVGFIIPSLKFNVVYQLAHIYRHLFTEGIGLRQLVDYYMILKSFCEADESGVGRSFVINEIKCLNMEYFAKAIMWVLKDTFKMPDDYLIFETSEQSGKFILDEIMKSGNFGAYDKRNIAMAKASKIKRFFLITKRNIAFATQYPLEVFFDPCIRLWNYLWRKFHLWKLL